MFSIKKLLNLNQFQSAAVGEASTNSNFKECYPCCAYRTCICWNSSITQLDIRRMYILDINQRHVSANSWPSLGWLS